MAANDYYTAHPQNPSSFQHPNQQQQYTFPADLNATNTSYEPYRLSASSSHHPPYPFSLSSSNLSTSPSNPSNLSTSYDSSSSTTTTDRGFLHPTSNNGPVLKKSKSERAIKFVEKQVKKQIDKKLNGHGHGGGGGGGHGYGQQIEEHVIQATEQDSSGSTGGEYGYGDSAQGYGFDQAGFGGNGGGEGFGGGNFEWAGASEGSGWFGDLDLGGFEG